MTTANYLNEFSKNLMGKSKNETLVFSPFSLMQALAMTANGATGDTQKEMVDTLTLSKFEAPDYFSKFSTTEKMVEDALSFYNYDTNKYERGSVILNTINRVAVESTFAINPQYVQSLKDNFNSDLMQCDFKNNADKETANINNFVSENTNKLIPSLIPDGLLNESTKLVLINAVYFNGTWEQSFNKELTDTQDFFVSKLETKQLEFMNNPDLDKLQYLNDEDAEILDLPYSNSNLRFRIILPNENKSLEAIAPTLDLYLGKLYTNLASVNLSMPKFKIEYEFPATDVLKSLGMEQAFEDTAEFDFMIDRTKDSLTTLKIGVVIHKAIIDLSETGTEAAAATAVAMFECTSFSMPLEVTIKLNRPFYFAIQDIRTNATLFLGKFQG